MTGNRGPNRDGGAAGERWTRCRDCGKRGYRTRKAAKRAKQGMYDNGTGMRAYACLSGNGLWHLGHLRRDYWTDDDEGV